MSVRLEPYEVVGPASQGASIQHDVLSQTRYCKASRSFTSLQVPVIPYQCGFVHSLPHESRKSLKKIIRRPLGTSVAEEIILL